jgi:hypothetical protein
MGSDSEDLFSSVIEALLSGAFICRYTDEVSYEYLSAEVYRQEVNAYLSKIGRCVAHTSSEDVFYCAFQSIEGGSRKAAIKEQFSETINTLEALVRWLKLTMSALQKESPLQPGDYLSQGDVLTAIEQTQTLSDDLMKITRSGPFFTKHDVPRDQLNYLMNKLAESGYLRATDPKASTYIATGRWSYVYDVLEFIHTHENLGSDEDAADDDQQELPL